MSKKSKSKRGRQRQSAPGGKVRIEPWGTMDEAAIALAMLQPLPCVLCKSMEQGKRAVFVPGSDAMNERLGAQGSKFRIATVNVCPGCVREHGEGPALSSALDKALDQFLDESWTRAKGAQSN